MRVLEPPLGMPRTCRMALDMEIISHTLLSTQLIDMIDVNLIKQRHGVEYSSIPVDFVYTIQGSQRNHSSFRKLHIRLPLSQCQFY